MTLAQTWAGRLFGTHTGNLAVKLSGDDRELSGVLRHNDPTCGITVYAITGEFDGGKLSIQGQLERQLDSAEFSAIKASAVLKQDGSLQGDWQSDGGAGGNFTLWPHDGSRSMPSDVAMPDQLHTVRHPFGPVVLERTDIIALADDIQKELPRARIVVTFDTGTEQSRYLPDFKEMSFASVRATLLKIHGAEPDQSGLDRVLSVEFGQSINVAMAQGVSRSWSLGAAENLRRLVLQHQRGYAKAQYGNLITQVIILGTIVSLPSMDTLTQRAALMLIAVLVVYAINRLHGHYLPNAAIYLGEKRESASYKAFQSFGLWIIGALGSIIVLLAGAYFKGMLRLP